MKTYQDFLKEPDKISFIKDAITEHRSCEDYKTAVDADNYEAEKNTTILKWMRLLYTLDGRKVEDITAGNNRIASNFFHRLNTQRCAYSLGNGVTFTNTKETTENGVKKTVDLTKQALGSKFDTDLYTAAYFALIHKVSFIMWNLDHAEIFPYTQFVPLWDENDGSLKAGIRYWSIDWVNRPVTAVLYELDGYTKYRTAEDSTGLDLEEIEPKRAYKYKVAVTEADGETIIGEDNYSSLPIVPLWGSKHKQSTLVGMKAKIDAFDLIRSGFANDLEECAEIYWIIENALGMDDAELAKFRDRMKMNHIVTVDTAGGSNVVPYTHEIPVTARQVCLDGLRAQLYEDFGGLDVHTIAAGATNDHIDAGYQPLDEEADDFEYQIIKCVQQILALIGIEDTPVFKRNRISNQSEQTSMVLLAADHLDEETILSKLPFLTVDEVQKVLVNKDKENMERIALAQELGELNA